MNGASDNQQKAERLESLKAGMLTGLSLSLAFIITIIINSLVLAKYFDALTNLRVNTANLSWLVSCAIATFSGFLFGVTYRYIIRSDGNPQLKAGAVLAFGLVRGLAQLDVGLSISGLVLPFVVLGLESVLWFAIAAIALDWAIQLGWVKPFKSS